MWCALGSARWHLGVTFASRLAIEADVRRKLGVQKAMLPIKNIRGITKRDMLHNDAMPQIEVDSRTFEVRVDGERLTCEPARHVPLCRKYLLR
jgi:urease subunit alpha